MRSCLFFFLLIYATSGFEPRLNPRSCVVCPLTTAGSAKISRLSGKLVQGAENILFQTRSAWRYQPYTFNFPYPKPKAPQSQRTRGVVFFGSSLFGSRGHFGSSLFGSRGHRMRRHRWSLKRHNKVPANHVASQKLPYPSLVAGAGRKHLPDGTPKPQTKWKTIREKSTNTPSISVSSNG